MEPVGNVGVVRICCLFLAALFTGETSPSPKYEVIEITPDLEFPTKVRDLNDENTVLGLIIKTNNIATSFIWESGQFTELNAFEGWNYAEAINKSGTVVGAARRGDEWHAWLYSKGTNYDLAPNGKFSWASDIDDNGDIIGVIGSTNCLFADHPILLTVPAEIGMSLRPLLRSKKAVISESIADLTGTELIHPIRLGRGASSAEDVNSLGHVAGSFDERFYPRQAGLWNGTNWLLLGTPLQVDAQANGINEADETVGIQFTDGVAMLWRNQIGIDLNSVTILPPGAKLTEAARINNRGFIAANLVVNHKARAVLLKPPPEPVHVPEFRLVTPAEKIYYTSNVLYSVEFAGTSAPIARVTYTTLRMTPGSSWNFRTNFSVEPPFSIVLTNVPAGQYAIQLRIEDSDGMIIHAPPSFYGVAGEARLIAYRRNWDDVFEYGLLGAAGNLFLIESSQDLRTWATVDATPFEAGYLTNRATAPQSFFRARMVRENLNTFGSWAGPQPFPNPTSLDYKRLFLFYGDADKELTVSFGWSGEASVVRERMPTWRRVGTYRYIPRQFGGKLQISAQEPLWQLDSDLEFEIGFDQRGRFRGTLIEGTATNTVSGLFNFL